MYRLTATKKTASITIRLTPQEKERIVAAAHDENQNISVFVVRVLNEYLDKMEDENNG